MTTLATSTISTNSMGITNITNLTDPINFKMKIETLPSITSVGLNKFRKSKIIKYNITKIRNFSENNILEQSKHTEFYYDNLTPIMIGDKVKLPNSILIGTVSKFKGALCVMFEQQDIKPVLFYDVYLHENNVIKAFQKVI